MVINKVIGHFLAGQIGADHSFQKTSSHEQTWQGQAVVMFYIVAIFESDNDFVKYSATKRKNKIIIAILSL